MVSTDMKKVYIIVGEDMEGNQDMISLYELRRDAERAADLLNALADNPEYEYFVVAEHVEPGQEDTVIEFKPYVFEPEENGNED